MSRPRLNRLALPALLLFLGAWGMWAVVSDNQPTFADSIVPDSQTLQETVLGDYGLGNYVRQLRYRPPLSHIPSALLFLLNGTPDLTLARLGVLLQYLLMVWVGFSIGFTAAGRGPGLMAALLVGTTPMLFGWGRLAYMDTGLALMVLVCLRVLMVNPLARKRDGVMLGLAAGGGMLTKVAFPIFAVGPLLWLLALRVRSLRAAGNLGIALATGLAVISWWLVPNFTAILTNAGMSSAESAGFADRLGVMARTFDFFVLDAPGGVLLFGATLAASLAAWFLKPKAGPERQFIALMLITLVLSLGLLLLFQPLPRYAVPVYAVAATLCGTCLGAVALDRGGRMGKLVLAALAGVSLLLFILLNLSLIQPAIPSENIVASSSPRVSSAGMLHPDRRDHSGLQQARDAMEKFGFDQCLVVATGPWVSERSQYQLDMLNAREARVIFHDRVSTIPRDKPACVLLLAGKDKEAAWKDFSPQNERGFYEMCRTHAWFKAVVPNPSDMPWCGEIKDPEATCELGSWTESPLEQLFYLIRVGPNQLPETLPEDPVCKLDQVDWEKVVQPENASRASGKYQGDPHAASPPEPEPGAEPPDPDLKEEQQPPPHGKDPDLINEGDAPAEPPDPDLKEEEQPRAEPPR